MTAGLVADHADGRSMTVSAGGVHLFRYVYRPATAATESPRPYLHPVRTLAGHVVTGHRPPDHPWHHGLALSLPVVGEHNFWGGPTYVRDRGYHELDDHGRMEHREVTDSRAAADRVTFAHRLDWTGRTGRRVIEEHRRLVVRPVDARTWSLEFGTAMTNRSGAGLSLGSPATRGRADAGYGGLFWRGPRSFGDGTIFAPGVEGGDELRGRRAAWMAFRGEDSPPDQPGRTSIVVIVDDPANPGHPVRWFARRDDYPGLGPAPFFCHEQPLADGETLRLRYAVLVVAGGLDVTATTALAERALAALAALPAPL